MLAKISTTVLETVKKVIGPDIDTFANRPPSKLCVPSVKKRLNTKKRCCVRVAKEFSTVRISEKKRTRNGMREINAGLFPKKWNYLRNGIKVMLPMRHCPK